jgi:hypothetical protein
MCGETTDLQPSSADEYVLDTPTVRSFVAGVQEAISGADGPAEDVESIRPIFSGLLAEEGWLPEEHQAPAPESGMGGGIGQWLLFLSAATSTGGISPAWSAATLATAVVAYPQSSEPACSWYVVTGPEPDLRRRTMGARGPESPCPSPLSSDPGSGSRTGGRRGPGTSQPRSGRGSPGSPA